jgi:hypothetical protein
MKSKVLGLYLVPASLLAIAGCVQPDGTSESNGDDADQQEDVGQASSEWGVGGAGITWGSFGAVPGMFGYGTPSLYGFRSNLHMLYRGVGGGIYSSLYNGTSWGAGVLAPNIVSGFAPALGNWGNNLYAVYPNRFNNRLMYSLWDGAGWGVGNYLGAGFAAAGAPSLAYFRGGLYTAFRGFGTNNLYWSRFDGRAWSNPYLFNGISAGVTPSLAAWGNRLNMFWPGNNNVYNWAAYDGANWGLGSAIPGLYGAWPLGVGVYNNTLAAIYPQGYGAGYGGCSVGGCGLGWAGYNGTAWGTGLGIPGTSALYTPGVALWGNRLGMAYFGARNQLYWGYGY